MILTSHGAGAAGACILGGGGCGRLLGGGACKFGSGSSYSSSPPFYKKIRTLVTGRALDERISWPRGYKTFFVLNSVEHEILNAHKYKNIKKFSYF